jgi:F-type H+-transporting ATPase subunit epsilon
MANTLQVEVVAADRLVWSGEATAVNARTAGGEIGVLANHMPVLSLMEPGAVEVDSSDGQSLSFAVGDGILSVANNRVSVLASYAEETADIDLSAARKELEDAKNDSHRSPSEIARLQARVRAAEKAS